MKNEFEMSIVRELTYFIGLQVKQLNKEIFISQNKYAKNLVKKFGLDNSKCTKTPMRTNDKLSKHKNGVFVDSTLFRSMIRSLLYLIDSKPDLCFSVGVCARY